MLNEPHHQFTPEPSQLDTKICKQPPSTTNLSSYPRHSRPERSHPKAMAGVDEVVKALSEKVP